MHICLLAVCLFVYLIVYLSFSFSFSTFLGKRGDGRAEDFSPGKVVVGGASLHITLSRDAWVRGVALYAVASPA